MASGNVYAPRDVLDDHSDGVHHLLWIAISPDSNLGHLGWPAVEPRDEYSNGANIWRLFLPYAHLLPGVRRLAPFRGYRPLRRGLRIVYPHAPSDGAIRHRGTIQLDSLSAGKRSSRNSPRGATPAALCGDGKKEVFGF